VIKIAKKYITQSAFEFFDLLGTELIEFLIEQYGSDVDIIAKFLEWKYRDKFLFIEYDEKNNEIEYILGE